MSAMAKAPRTQQPVVISQSTPLPKGEKKPPPSKRQPLSVEQRAVNDAQSKANYKERRNAAAWRALEQQRDQAVERADRAVREVDALRDSETARQRDIETAGQRDIEIA